MVMTIPRPPTIALLHGHLTKGRLDDAHLTAQLAYRKVPEVAYNGHLNATVILTIIADMVEQDRMVRQLPDVFKLGGDDLKRVEGKIDECLSLHNRGVTKQPRDVVRELNIQKYYLTRAKKFEKQNLPRDLAVEAFNELVEESKLWPNETMLKFWEIHRKFQLFAFSWIDGKSR